MAEAAVQGPHCQSKAVVKYGKASNGKERFRCQHSAQCGRTCLRNYAYPGCLPTVKHQLIETRLNGSGIRDIARVLQVGPNTVPKEIKKKRRARGYTKAWGKGVVWRRFRSKCAAS